MAWHSAVRCIAPLHYHHYQQQCIIMLLQHTCCTLHMGRHWQGLGCIMHCTGVVVPQPAAEWDQPPLHVLSALACVCACFIGSMPASVCLPSASCINAGPAAGKRAIDLLSCCLLPHAVLNTHTQVMGPLLGGALSQVWGWRSTFIALTVFAALTGVVIVALIRTETHQYFVLKKLAARDPDHAKGLQEWEGVISHPPVFSAPWVPLRWVAAGVCAPAGRQVQEDGRCWFMGYAEERDLEPQHVSACRRETVYPVQEC